MQKIRFRFVSCRRFIYRTFALVAFVLGPLSEQTLMAQSQFDFTMSTETDIAISSAANDGVYAFTADHLRSYCCAISGATDNGPSPVLSEFKVLTNSSQFPTTLETMPGTGGQCFIVPFSSGQFGQGSAGVRFRLSTTGVTSFAGSLKLRCTETTLTVGYNTSVTDFNFLEVTNLRPSTKTVFQAGGLNNVAARIYATNSTGGSPFSTLSVVFPEEKRTDIDIHSLTGAGQFGTIRIPHYGSPGDLSCALSQYTITSTNPLDFQPVVREPCIVGSPR